MLVWGHAEYGRIDDYGGEHASTVFFHASGVPIVPIGSYWVSRESGQRVATPIPLSGKSVAAGYLRVAAPVIALLMLLLAPAIGLAVALSIAAPLALASAWSWRWASLHDERVRRRSDFCLLAFGARCSPARLSAEQRARCRLALDERWAELGVVGSPDDVAERGATSSEEAIAAFGLLALAAADATSDARKHAAEAAERIVAGAYGVTVGEGPYRIDREAVSSDAIVEVVASTAAAVSAERSTRPPVKRVARSPLPPRRAWWLPTPRRSVIAIMLLLAGLGALGANASALLRSRDVQVVSERELAATVLPTDDPVELHCDRLELRGEFSTRPPTPLYTCEIGASAVVVVGPVGDGGRNIVLTGTLHMFEDLPWPLPDEVRGRQLASVFFSSERRGDPEVVVAWFGIIMLSIAILILLPWLVYRVRHWRQSAISGGTARRR